MNPQGNERNLHNPKFTKTALQEEDLLRLTHYNLVHKFLPMPQATKISDAKAAVDKAWKKFETIPAWDLEKAKSKEEVFLEAQRDKQKVHIPTIVDRCQLKNAELDPKITEVQRQSRAPRGH